jgi:signal transduction histidine kinase
MDRPVRIAVVGSVDDKLLGDLRQLPMQPEVRPLSSLVHDTEALMRLQPDLLLIHFAEDPGEDIGAVRLLQRLWPALQVAIVTTTGKEIPLGPIAKRLSAQLLIYPDTPGHLAALLEQMLQGGDRPHPELFVDLAHGLADEINNPLMFVSGHLQLLRASLDSKLKDSQRDQVDAALTGLKRIQAAVDRLRLLSEAANGPSGQEAADLGALVARAVAERNPGAETAKVTTPSEPQIVHGDREQLALAVDAIVQFADELSEAVTDCQLQLTQTESAYRLRVLASGQGLATWQLPKTFEPFYPQRLLRGQSHGLGLFLAQTVVLGHRGQATVRRLQDGALQLDFMLPRDTER